MSPFDRAHTTSYVNGGAKCRKWGGFGWLGGTQGHGQCHHSIERIRLPIQKRNYAVILYRFRDIASYLLKVADDFNLPHRHLASHGEFR